MADTKAFGDYVSNLRTRFGSGDATEHTHRPALQTLLESAFENVVATNEPKRIECGAPDFLISRPDGARQTIGYIEAKDIDTDLTAIVKDSNRNLPATDNGRQLKRYRASISNLILTNYTEFRWFVDGVQHKTSTLAEMSANGSSLFLAESGIEQANRLLDEFLQRNPDPVSNPEQLAHRMARLTHIVRDIVQRSFERGEVSRDVQDLYQASLLTVAPDITIDAFADMFAQTLAYGLFAARVNRPVGEFRRHDAAYQIPPTNPLIQRIFSFVAGPGLDNEPFASFVDDLTQLLGTADIAAVLAHFGERAAQQDPIMHFYETFLDAYDPALRERRGVYYTPEPVVSYIVRSVDWLLKQRFDCVDGLADYSTTRYFTDDIDGGVTESTAHRVLVLDPACGTGSFLYAVIDHIRDYYNKTNQAGIWRSYVKDHLLSRLFGFELLMAPYAMAHLKLGMQLAALDLPEGDRQDWAYDLSGAERLRVYLTNSLEVAEREMPTMFGPLRALTEEANAAAEIKRDIPIMVVLGNPPYSGHSANKGEWIGELIEDYKQVDGQPLGERNTKWLQDDYVKFIRFGQWRIQQTGTGILAFITNHAYMTNPTFRGMRQQLMDTFTEIYVLDLHGNSRTGERSPDGSDDENVFDIQQGVAIGIFVKQPDKPGPAKVHHADLYGIRSSKYRVLSRSDISSWDISATNWECIEPESPSYLFKPRDKDLEEEYLRWPRISEVMPANSVGVITARDSLTIRWSRDEVMPVVTDFAALTAETARSKYGLGPDSDDWKVGLAQDDLKNSHFNDDLAVPILYRPFDTRYTYYTGKSNGFICRPRSEVMMHTLGKDNLGLLTTRRIEKQDAFDRVFVSKEIADGHMVSLKEISYQYPLYTYPNEQEIASGLYKASDREPNLSLRFTAGMEQSLGLEYVTDGIGDLENTFGPEDAFHYIYAVFHSPTYRQRYDQFLRADFPRVPSISDAGSFRQLVLLGRQLTAMHLLEHPSLSQSPLGFPIGGDYLIESGHPKYYAPGETPPGENAPIEQGRVYISANGKGRNRGKRGQYFEGIAPAVWQFRIGSYQPLNKWLKDRTRRQLSFDDLDHYGKIAGALGETIKLMTDIDDVIAGGGGLFSQM